MGTWFISCFAYTNKRIFGYGCKNTSWVCFAFFSCTSTIETWTIHLVPLQCARYSFLLLPLLHSGLFFPLTTPVSVKMTISLIWHIFWLKWHWCQVNHHLMWEHIWLFFKFIVLTCLVYCIVQTVHFHIASLFLQPMWDPHLYRQNSVPNNLLSHYHLIFKWILNFMISEISWSSHSQHGKNRQKSLNTKTNWNWNIDKQ